MMFLESIVYKQDCKLGKKKTYMFLLYVDSSLYYLDVHKWG